MKIKDFAVEKGLSKQAIYKAISRAGFSARQITDRNGNITNKGFTVLRSLFPDADLDRQQESKPEEGQQQTEQQAAEIERLQKRVEELEASCKQWEQRYFDAVEAAKQEAQQMRVLISREQELRLAAERKGLFRRLFAGRKAEEE